MTCKGCGDEPIGILEGELVCGRCAQMTSVAQQQAEERRAHPRVVVRCGPPAGGELAPLLLAQLRRANEEWLFFARAREAAANGGCRL